MLTPNAKAHVQAILSSISMVLEEAIKMATGIRTMALDDPDVAPCGISMKIKME